LGVRFLNTIVEVTLRFNYSKEEGSSTKAIKRGLPMTARGQRVFETISPYKFIPTRMPKIKIFTASRAIPATGDLAEWFLMFKVDSFDC
jgi:hypothetical protein